MRTIRLGKSDLYVSQIGFGGIPITRLSRNDAVDCIHAAIDHGINFFDTATGYHDSEEKIGCAIKGIRDKLILASKAAASDPQTLVDTIDLSLKRLKTDHIDLYQFHLIKDREGMNKALDLLEVFEKAKKAGKIGHIGTTVHGVDFINVILDRDEFETVMIALNFIVCEPENHLSKAAQNDIGVIAMKPMGGGEIDNATLAMKYFYDKPDVVPLVGFESAQEIKEVVSIIEADNAPTQADLAEMENIRSEIGNRFCRRCQYCMSCEHGVQIFPLTILKSLIRRLPPEKVITGGLQDAVATLEKCIQCRKCEAKCPYDLDIVDLMNENAQWFNELKHQHTAQN